MSTVLERTDVHPDAGSLAIAAATASLAKISSIQGLGRRPFVALTGGSIAERIYQCIGELAQQPSAPEIDWSEVSIWWGDERYVDADSEDRNDSKALAGFIEAVGATDVHRMPAKTSGVSADAAADRYAQELDDAGWTMFDVVLLGLGPDGHIASLFPHRSNTLELVEDVVAEMNSPKPPPTRITLTRPALNRAHAVWFLVSGSDKANAVIQARSRGPLSACPARGVRGEQETVWFLDRESSGN